MKEKIKQVLSKNQIFSLFIIIVISGTVILGVIGGVAIKNKITYENCLDTWLPEYNKLMIKRFKLTKEDFCKKGYTLSDALLLIENITSEVKEKYREEDISLYEKFKKGISIYEKTEKIEGEIEERIRLIIKPE